MPLVAVSPHPDSAWIAWSFAHSLERVWAALTEREAIARWLGEVVEWDIRPGGTLVVDHGEGARSRSAVLEADPPRRLTMTWDFPDEPASHVAITLRASEDRAVLELVHSGLAELAESYRIGWITHLTYLEAAMAGVPLPASQFWSLHETLTRGLGGGSAAPDRPETVCICGSMRFPAEMRDAAHDLALAGVIVVAPADAGGPVDEEQKAVLDALHLRKIDLADRVLVVNPGGYVGESTRREIAYARAAGKPVSFTDPT
ncbi:SRPBCC domain-containing protein [Clavibacter michiganensis]|uniref:Activator of Hsp90 ATPase homologue 1/2-like C-terminal domain-containing protein n=1 Tax=Clavibacter michiganensis TaxID=28447 RepID=A0A251YHE3_9MICO|nr:hypothetical protein BFL37_13430 [Clavibacter michiganensis]